MIRILIPLLLLFLFANTCYSAPSKDAPSKDAAHLGTGTHATKAIKISLRDIPLPDGVRLITEDTIRVAPGTNADIVLDISSIVAEVPMQKLWLRARVKSSRQLTDILYNNSEKEFFSYHNGDGSSQILLSEVVAPKANNRATIRLLSSEKKERTGVVEIGPIVLSLEQSDVSSLGISTIDWARTNNPDPQFFFDRYTSQLKDFSVTIPNSKHATWERYFGVGVNDRFNSGDYFCYPDDALVLRSQKTHQVYHLYLGLLAWNRKIVPHKGTLQIEFTYKGRPELAPEARQASKLQGMATDHWAPPSDITISMQKKFVFRTDSNTADIQLSAAISSEHPYDGAWVIQDGAFMDFSAGNSEQVHSLIGGAIDKGGVWHQPGQLATQSHAVQKSGSDHALAMVQYRERAPQASLASTIISPDADLSFALPVEDVWPFISGWFSGEQLARKPELNPFSIAKPDGSAWIFGKVFFFSSVGNIKKNLKIGWTSGFAHSDLQTLPELLFPPELH